MTDHLEILRQHNEWRRGAETEMLEPKVIGQAIDTAINEILSLRKQFGAAKMLIKSSDARLIKNSKELSKMDEAINSLESERKANERLTNELEMRRRGECICARCGLRQDSEQAQGEF